MIFCKTFRCRPWERNLDILVHACLGCKPCCSSGLSFSHFIHDGSVRKGDFFTKFSPGINFLIFWYVRWLYHGTDPSSSLCCNDIPLSPTTADGQSPSSALGTFDFSAGNQPAICSSEMLPYWPILSFLSDGTVSTENCSQIC